MSIKRQIVLTLAILTLTTKLYGGWSIGFSFSKPVGRGCYPYHYRRPYCVYPRSYYYRPVYVQPRPIIVEQPVQLVQPIYQPRPRVEPMPAPPTSTTRAPITSTVSNNELTFYLQKLRHPEENERREAAIQLGRMRLTSAAPHLQGALTTDRSPKVREAAARGLGLIGSPDALPALERAAQQDEDRDVRHSASFAVDVIRTR